MGDSRSWESCLSVARGAVPEVDLNQTGDVLELCTLAYRERFLYEKGGDLPPIVIDAEVDDTVGADDEESSIDLLGILESEGIVDGGEGQSPRTIETWL
jgi:hypothetical protein